MNVLALDTSMGACSAALLIGNGGRRFLARQESMARGHAEALLPMVAEIMTEATLPLTALDVIAATTGPGSFTGVRIAIAAARGLALAVHAKLFGIDSLTVMARQAAVVADGRPFAVAVDARRGMLYFSLFDAAGRRQEGPLLVTPEAAAIALPRTVHVAAGSGAALLEKAAGCGQTIETTLLDLQPSAEALAELALESGEWIQSLKPLYLRPPDAKPQAQTQVARR